MAEPKEKRKVYITWESGVDSWRETYQTGDVIRLPQAPTRNGYDFKGWWTKPREGGEQLSDEDVVEGNETYFARWKLIEHTVTLIAALPTIKEDNTQEDGSVDISIQDSEDGEQDEDGNEYYDIKTIAEIKVPHGSSVKNIPDVERLGCEFIGWFYEQPEDEGGKTIQQANDYRIVSDMVFHAHFEPIKYNLVLDCGTSQDVEFINGKISQYTVLMTPYELPIPTRRKYSFGYWYATGDETQTPVKCIPALSTGDLSYTAHWETGKYLVVIKIGEDERYRISVKYGTTIAEKFKKAKDYINSLGDPSKVFRGWQYFDNNRWVTIEDEEKWSPEFDVVVEAIIEPTRFNVTINKLWEENPEDAVKTVVVEYGGRISEEDLSEPPEEVNEGRTFIGWWTDPSGGVRVRADTRVTSDMSLYPLWQDNGSIDVTLDANQGIFDWMKMKYPYGTIVSSTDLPTPTRVGYDFKGWWYKFRGDDGETSEGELTQIEVTGELRIYAKWEPDQSHVIFHSNGGMRPKIII